MSETTHAQHWIATSFGDLDGLHFDSTDLRPPATGEVTIDVKAAGVNPVDYKMVQHGNDPGSLPLAIGFEVAGVIAAIGPDTELGGGLGIGDDVIAFRVTGGYATSVTVSADDVFAKPAALDYAEAANLFLAGTTAAELLHVASAAAGDTIVVHGASGAVGVSVLQQARLLGVRVIGTASAASFDVVREFGGEPVAYGDGVEERIREVAPDGIAAALDCVGTDEAVDTSLALVSDRRRIVTIAAFGRAESDGIQAIGGSMPASAAFRDEVRERLVQLAAAGELVVPVARSYPLAEAKTALTFLQEGHPGGKLALLV